MVENLVTLSLLINVFPRKLNYRILVKLSQAVHSYITVSELKFSSSLKSANVYANLPAICKTN